MNRDAVRVGALAVVCILAVAVGAATLDSPTTVRSGGVGSGGGDGLGGSGGDGVDTGGESDGGGIEIIDVPAGEFPRPRICVAALRSPGVQAGILLAFLVGWLAVRRATDAFAATALAATFAVPGVLLYALLTACRPVDSQGSGAPPALTNGSTGGGSAGTGLVGEVAAVRPTQLPPVVFVVAGAAVLVALAAVLRDREGGVSELLAPVRTDAADGDGDGDAAGAPEATAAVGAAAGRAADRIEGGVDVENEVYRAWREMTDSLEVDRPHSSTPGEFAAAAVDAGMDRADVAELTRLFEEVRYGGYDADEDRERRAVAALRRIEAEYAGDGE